MTPPTWAIDLVNVVCDEAGIAPPRLMWRRRAHASSTGIARRHDGLISVRAGTDALDQRLTLLHELAHWLAPMAKRRRGRSQHHGREFYAIAFGLYHRHGIPDEDALRLESSRYRSSLRHAAALGVSGAAAALGEHNARLRARPRREWRVVVPEHRVTLGREDRWSVCVTCGQRIVGATLQRVRRARRPVRHVLMAASASWT